MEVYINSIATARTVYIPFGAPATSVDVSAYRDDVKVFEFTTVSAGNGGYSVVIPMFLTQFDSDLKIHWAITYTEEANGQEYTVNKVSLVEVVTPILTKAEVLEIDENLFASDYEYLKIEKAVRHIIQAYTGQEFGHYIGTHSVKGNGSSALQLPKRLLDIDTMDGNLASDTNTTIDANGFVLRFYPFGVPPLKADFWGLHMHTGGVIHNPNNVRLSLFNASHSYKIAGRWGYEAVPQAVKEAAKLLVNDYACADSQYRDRYLTSMTAADWRIQFNSGAFARTGNVRADQLLSEFVITRGWGVI